MKVFGWTVLIVLVIFLLWISRMGFGWFGRAVDVVPQEVDPFALQKKYNDQGSYPPIAPPPHSKSQSVQVTPWEHGWKTENVVATRYKNKFIGYNVSFEFPNDLNNGDRSELFEFIGKHGGNVYEGGGYPGAPLYTTFKEVTDKSSADKKLQEILPELEKFIVSLR